MKFFSTAFTALLATTALAAPVEKRDSSLSLVTKLDTDVANLGALLALIPYGESDVLDSSSNAFGECYYDLLLALATAYKTGATPPDATALDASFETCMGVYTTALSTTSVGNTFASTFLSYKSLLADITNDFKAYAKDTSKVTSALARNGAWVFKTFAESRF